MIRLQHKPMVIDSSKKSVLKADYDRQVTWYSWNEIYDYFNTDVNQNQVSRLSSSTRRFIENEIAETMSGLGYLSEV